MQHLKSIKYISTSTLSTQAGSGRHVGDPSPRVARGRPRRHASARGEPLAFLRRASRDVARDARCVQAARAAPIVDLI